MTSPKSVPAEGETVFSVFINHASYTVSFLRIQIYQKDRWRDRKRQCVRGREGGEREREEEEEGCSRSFY